MTIQNGFGLLVQLKHFPHLRSGFMAIVAIGVLCGASAAQADLTVPIAQATEHGPGKALGQITISESEYGLVFTPDIKGLKPGLHGFHVHEKPSCDPAEKDGKMTPAGGAGPHLDPDGAGKHGAPWGDGHLGDLPALYVAEDGTATHPVLAPRLNKLSQVEGHALMLHEGGDNYSDHPMKLGGGGGRFACGVVKQP